MVSKSSERAALMYLVIWNRRLLFYSGSSGCCMLLQANCLHRWITFPAVFSFQTWSLLFFKPCNVKYIFQKLSEKGGALHCCIGQPNAKQKGKPFFFLMQFSSWHTVGVQTRKDWVMEWETDAHTVLSSKTSVSKSWCLDKTCAYSRFTRLLHKQQA